MDTQSWSLVMLVGFCCHVNALRGIEKECTRFEYDVQMLEKMVKFEHKIELMEERLKTCLQGWDEKETKLTSEIKTLSYTLKKEQETKLQNLEKLSDTLKTEQEIKLQNLEKLSDTLKIEQETKLQNLEKLSDTLKTEQATKLQNLEKLSDTLKTEQGTKLQNLEKLSDTLNKEQETKLEKFEKLSGTLKTEQETKLQSLESARLKVLADTKEQMMNVNQTIDNFKGMQGRPSVYFHYYYITASNFKDRDQMKFKTKVSDSHNAYDTATGCFTTPVNGVYLFILQLKVELEKMVDVQMYVNGKHYITTIFFNPRRVSSNMIVPVSLDSGDKVCLSTGSWCSAGEIIHQPTFKNNFFSGILVG